jgi:hypothetical protein
MKPPVPDPWRLCSGEVVLAAVPAAVGGARRFTEAWLRARQLTGLTGTVCMIVSELITSSVTASERSGRRPAPVTLRLTLAGAGLFVIVLDPHPGVPAPREGDDPAGTARGLPVVASLARSWGHYPVGAGQAVWAEVGAAGAGRSVPHPAAGAGPAGGAAAPERRLPHREPGTNVAPREVRAMRDVGTLRRVLDGLHRLDEH